MNYKEPLASIVVLAPGTRTLENLQQYERHYVRSGVVSLILSRSTALQAAPCADQSAKVHLPQ